MTQEYARDMWRRAVNALKSAKALLRVSADDAASRAYYAAFNAVSAWFAWDGKTFVKHSAVRAAVHRELVKTGLWPASLGESFDAVWELRDVGDYGGVDHVLKREAEQAVKAAARILACLREMRPELEGEK